MLQEKLNRYLAFIESGELIEQYPAAVGRSVRVDVRCKYAPTNDGERFLRSARTAIEEAGFSLSWGVLAV